MSRILCKHCERPEKTCICRYFSSTANSVNVIVLQHPSEVKQSKGSLPILKHSLQNCTVYVGEDFSQNEHLNNVLNTHRNEIALLYPSDNAKELKQFSGINSELNVKLNYLIVLDGTWKKAYKLFQLNSFLHQITHVKLPNALESLYQIRKTNKLGALSTLEACCHALSCLEGDELKYQKILNNFVEFNEMQLAFR